MDEVFFEDIIALLYEKSFNLKPNGNKVYYSHALMLPIKTMMCSKPHYRKVLD